MQDRELRNAPPKVQCPRTVIGLGSNLGDRAATLDAAIAAIARLPGLELLRQSSIWRTEPVGGPPQPDYYNMAVLVRLDMPPLELLEALSEIETRFGRVRTVRNGPRTLDLDVLWIEGTVVCHPRLEIPHPRLHERAFALAPMIEVARDARDPRSSVFYCALLEKCGTHGLRCIRRPLDAPTA